MGSATSSSRISLVMSGGGARGAYEAGVLSYLFDELPALLGRPTHFDIVTGTSVGAVHACWVAATQDDPGAGRRLTEPLGLAVARTGLSRRRHGCLSRAMAPARIRRGERMAARPR